MPTIPIMVPKVDTHEDSSENESSTGGCMGGGCAPDWLYKIVTDKKGWFQNGIMGIIILNVFLMTIETDYQHVYFPKNCHRQQINPCYNVWKWVNLALLAIFVVELTLRFICSGCRMFFFDPKDASWNILDFIIVALGVGDVASRYLFPTRPSDQVMVVIRTFRILRVLRVMRLLRQFGKLRLIVAGLLESVYYVIWITMFAVFWIAVFGIIFTTLIGQNSDKWKPLGQEQQVLIYFGTVCRSMFTLFQILTLDDWNAVVTMITEVMPNMTIIFFIYVVLMNFILVSLFTGSMVEHINAVNQTEDEETEEQATRDRMLTIFQTEFRKERPVDADLDAYIDKREFMSLCQDDELKERLGANELRLTNEDASQFFELFDKDNDNRLSATEFKSGVEDYRKGLTKKSVVQLKKNFVKMIHIVEGNGGVPPAWCETARKPSAAVERKMVQSDARLAQIEATLARFEEQVAEIRQLTMSRREEEGAESVSEE